jgi:signal transduction histidine kinase
MNVLGHLPGAVRRHPHLADAAIALAVLAATAATRFTGDQTATAGGRAIAIVAAVLACGALTGRRHRPLASLVVSALAAEVFLFVTPDANGVLILLAPCIALYTVAELVGRRRGLIVGGSALAALALLHALMHPGMIGPENLAFTALGGLAITAGDSSRNRRAYLTEVERRAERSELEREFVAQRRVEQERLRIARDLHDSLGHQLALIAVQAAVADQVLGSSPHQAHEALAHVTSASRSALAELSDTIGLLREPGDTATLAQPQPGLDSLSELIASFAAPGLHVALEVAGCQRPLTPAASITAYRVIQESLTNICKHAAIRSAQVRLAYEPAHLQITVRNGPGHLPASRGTASGRRGHGIAGMRERVTAAGGLLEAGTCPGGGFQVRATIPLTPATPPASTGAPRRPGPAVPPGAAPHAPSAVAAARA